MEIKPEFQFEQQDVQQNKTMAILAYILFLIPLLAAPNSKFAKYHTNQGLVLFLTGFAIGIVGNLIPIIGPLLIVPIAYIGIFVLAIIGIVNASKGEAKPLPIIGGISILK